MADFTAMVENQRKYFESQATKSYEFRREQLKKLQGWMTKNEQAILDALHEDLGKSDYEGYLTEVAMVKQELADALKAAARHLPRSVRALRRSADYVPVELSLSADAGPIGGSAGGGQLRRGKAVGLFARHFRADSPHGGGAFSAGAGESGGGRTYGKRRSAGRAF